MMDQTEIYDVHFQLTAPRPGPDEEAFQGGLIGRRIQFNQVLIDMPGREAETLQRLANEEQGRDPDEEEYELEFPEGSIVTVPDFPDYPAHGYSITGVSFKVRYNPPITEEIVVHADDHVYMVMESIFDGRRFTIAKDGEIRETHT